MIAFQILPIKIESLYGLGRQATKIKSLNVLYLPTFSEIKA